MHVARLALTQEDEGVRARARQHRTGHSDMGHGRTAQNVVRNKVQNKVRNKAQDKASNKVQNKAHTSTATPCKPKQGGAGRVARTEILSARGDASARVRSTTSCSRACSTPKPLVMLSAQDTRGCHSMAAPTAR